MGEQQFILDVSDKEDTLHVKKELSRFVRYWPLFLLCLFIALVGAYFYIKYTPTTYKTVAKIKILEDDSEINFVKDAFSLGSSQVNLDNEVEVIKSFRILSAVVDDLNLDVDYYEVGKIKKSQLWNAPFVVTKQIEEDSIIEPMSYLLSFNESEVTITDSDENKITKPLNNSSAQAKDLPFTISLVDSIPNPEIYGVTYEVTLYAVKDIVQILAQSIDIDVTSKDSDILELVIEGQRPRRNEAIINKTIEFFDKDGILDRQEVSKRTVDFIDERFSFLASELDSVEDNLTDYKKDAGLSYIEADAGITMEEKSFAEEQARKLETQVSLSRLLKETLTGSGTYELLPADIGLESRSINVLVGDYNTAALERQRIVASAGENNPRLVALSGQLDRVKRNILQTVNVYQENLRIQLDQLNRQRYRAGGKFAALPEKQQKLNALTRNANIKQSLYILLLEKREEAAINFAVTAPTLKVVDYGLTNGAPVGPNKKLIFGSAAIAGLIIPFAILFIMFSVDSKVRSRFQVEGISDIPILTDIPHFNKVQTYSMAGDKSMLAESFRLLGTNVNFMLKKQEAPHNKVVYVTSAIKEEGKSLIAVNLSMALAGLKKKVLLVGTDFRNPQLHKYLNGSKQEKGLSNYLGDETSTVAPLIKTPWKDNNYHSVIYSGTDASNAPQLLYGDRFKGFLEDMKEQFDYIIVDTAPTLLVTDTLLISELADVTLFVLRANKSDKKLLKYSAELSETGRIKNMAYVLNDVKQNSQDGYNYGHEYGYGEASSKPWYKKIFS